MTASLATCPLCAKQLAIPAGTSADDRAECPECDATFLLSNAFQTSLPTARILQTTESSPSAEKNSSEAQPAHEVADVSSLASWESRLKNAIERDTDELADQPGREESLTVETATAETPATETRPASPSQPSGPEFEFHIDPPVAAQTLKTEKKSAPEFDQVGLLATESAESLTSQTKELEVTPVEDEPVAAELAAKEAAELTMGLSTLHPRRSRRFSALKMTAMLIGPGLMGVFLGLYALLWIKGPSGDLINLAKVLPPAMLPPAATTGELDSSQETTPPVDSQQLLVQEEPAEPSVPAAAEPEPTEPSIHEPPRNETGHDETGHDETVHDPEVQLAAAESPVPRVLNALPDLFDELLAAALASEPSLVGGDLNTNEAVSQKGHAYMTICQLAQNFEVVHTSDLDAQSQAKIASAEELFASLASNLSARDDLAAITSRWWGYESRPNQGIFLVGQIQKSQPLGDQTLCYVALDEPATTTIIPVLLDQPIGHEGDRILAVGCIVSEPRSSLPGFTADVSQVVAAAYSRVLQP